MGIRYARLPPFYRFRWLACCPVMFRPLLVLFQSKVSKSSGPRDSQVKPFCSCHAREVYYWIPKGHALIPSVAREPCHCLNGLVITRCPRGVSIFPPFCIFGAVNTNLVSMLRGFAMGPEIQ